VGANIRAKRLPRWRGRRNLYGQIGRHPHATSTAVVIARPTSRHDSRTMLARIFRFQ
jgi:hypothetical protein